LLVGGVGVEMWVPIGEVSRASVMVGDADERRHRFELIEKAREHIIGDILERLKRREERYGDDLRCCCGEDLCDENSGKNGAFLCRSAAAAWMEILRTEDVATNNNNGNGSQE
jgi:hypothetical protein